MNAKQIEAKCELEFRRGYLLATANIMRTHDQGVIAEDVLGAYVTTGNINWRGIDPMEIKILKPIAAEIRRKRNIS